VAMANMLLCMTGALVQSTCSRACSSCPCSIKRRGGSAQQRVHLVLNSGFFDSLEPGFMDSRRPYVELHGMDGEQRQTSLGEWNAGARRWYWEEPIICEVGREDVLQLLVHTKIGIDVLAFQFTAATSEMGYVSVPMAGIWKKMQVDDRRMWTSGPLTFDVICDGKRGGQLTLTCESPYSPTQSSSRRTFGGIPVGDDLFPGEGEFAPDMGLGCPVLPWSREAEADDEGFEDQDSTEAEETGTATKRRPIPMAPGYTACTTPRPASSLSAMPIHPAQPGTGGLPPTPGFTGPPMPAAARGFY